MRVVPEEERMRAQFTRTADTGDASVLKTTFSQLPAFTAYRVFVAAYTVVGRGPENTAPPLLQTGEDSKWRLPMLSACFKTTIALPTCPFVHLSRRCLLNTVLVYSRWSCSTRWCISFGEICCTENGGGGNKRASTFLLN